MSYLSSYFALARTASLIVCLSGFLSLTPVLAQEKATSLVLSENVFTYQGELPILISAPHGGTREIPGVPPRSTEGKPTGGAGFVTARDTATEELAHLVVEAIEKRMGKRPYAVISRTHRRYLDPNRPPEIAYDHEGAKPVYAHYHQHVEKYCREIVDRFHAGLLLDLHGQGSDRKAVFRGTQNGATVKHLRETFGESAHTGERSFFGMLQKRGWKVHPVPFTDPEMPGFNGGYIVKHYGTMGIAIDAIQLEFGAEYRVSSRIQDTANVLADSVAEYADAYLKIARGVKDTGAVDRKASPEVRIAVFQDEGVSSTDRLMSALASSPALQVETVSAEDIRRGKLDAFDVLIHPGGSGSKQGAALGEEGRARVRDFVQSGHGMIGICAGAYLASCDYSWSLNLLDAKVLDRQHWNRGFGPVEIRLSESGREVLESTTSTPTIYYHQGPLLAPAGNESIPDYESLATYTGDIAKNGASKGVMPGTTAIARGTFGEGRVFCFSPHPEKTDGLEAFVLEAIEWVDRQK